MTTQSYPLFALRALALHTQQLNAAPPSPSPDAIYDVVAQLGAVQIDTLHVVARSQYLLMWSRLGNHDPADFDRLIFEPGERRLFEYWGHAASIMPLTDYRYHIPVMKRVAEKPGNWFSEWLNTPESKKVIAHIVERITDEGGLRSADFKQEKKAGSWWNWKPAKRALEYLFARGDLMIADRVNFQRVYDLKERVLPDWVDQTAPTHDEYLRYYVEQAGKALGISRPMQIAEYAYMKRGSARSYIEELTGAGVFVPVRGELADGSAAELVVHRDNLPLLRQAADGAIRAERTTFLSPFDSLFWARGRDEDFWGFRQVLESYKKQEDRIWGYFCLPILHRDRLVGRFDPKLERGNGKLILRALHLEPGIEPDDGLVGDVAGAMRDFLAFHHADEVVIEPDGAAGGAAAFGEKLLKAL